MSTEEWGAGYDEGYMKGWNDAMDEKPAQTDWEAVAADQAMTIALLKAEQPAQQEPDFYRHEDGHLMTPSRAKFLGLDLNELQPLYTSPPVQQNIRNATLDEIATKIEAMPFGDTAASFAVWIREQKT